jgi:hypothetical protein
MHFAPWVYALIFLTGLVAGVADSIAGGGGLIALPVLLGLGLPVPVALGTNKLQSMCGVASAAWHYARRGMVDFRACRLGIFTTFMGAVAGVLTVQHTDTHLLGRVIPWLLLLILLYTIFRPAVGEQDQPPRMRAGVFFTVFGLVLGFYDGFFGPGAGSFWAIALIIGLGQNFAKATAHTKIMNLVSNAVAVVLFGVAGLINYPAAIAMGAGQIIGGRIGSGLVVKKGARFVRPIFLIVVSLTLLRLIWVNYR